MKWKKIGKIFDPLEHSLPANCTSYAQSPQALVFDDFVRIYFSTREIDGNGKYLSHVAYVDFDPELKKLITISKTTVIPLGDLGCYDEHGIFPFNVFRSGDKIFGYISGWSRRVSVSVETAIGLSVSLDEGESFKRLGDGPILNASIKEPFLVGDPFVQFYNGQYHMWYIFGTRWVQQNETSAPDRIYKIGHATSFDGIIWQREGRQIIADSLNEMECQALPTVFEDSGIYHMYFCYRNVFGFREKKENAYQLGYAYSEDLIHWRRDDKQSGIELSRDGWDSDMMCYPHTFKNKGNVYLLYNGNRFGHAGFGAAVLEK